MTATTTTTTAPAFLADLLSACEADHRGGGSGELTVSLRLLVGSVETRTARTGRDFHVVGLSDRTGACEARDFSGAAKDLPVPCAATVTLKSEIYNERPTLVVQAAEPVPGEIDLLEFTAFDRDANARHRRELGALIRSMPDGPFRRIVNHALAPHYEDFCIWPAAVRHHHNYPGGLIEHTLEVTRYALGLAELDADPYDRELLLAACLLHDIGKLDEYDRPPLLRFSASGELAYHLAHGQVRLGIAVAQARAAGSHIPDRAVWQICHCIEQSHGAHRLDQVRHAVGKEAKCLAAADDHSAKRSASDRELRVLSELVQAA